jgi:2-dehydropantoate 2-reductase
MKICIYGAGVIGGMLAGSFVRAGHEVSAIARGAHLDAIRAKGLTITNPKESVTHKIAASSSPGDFGAQDVVIIATKTPALEEVAASIAPLVGPKTMVGFAVNGIFWFYGDGFQPNGARLDLSRLDPQGILHKAIGAERSLGVVCWSGGEIREPGVIHATRPGGRIAIGPALASNAALSRNLVADMKVTDLTFEAADDVRVPMWEKYIGVVGNFAICALTGGTIGQVHGDKGTQDVLLAVQSEADAIARAHGFNNTGFNIEKSRMTPTVSPHKPSMLQDLERGRRMEIESSYLILQDLARQAEIKTPALDMVVPLLVARARNAGSY